MLLSKEQSACKNIIDRFQSRYPLSIGRHIGAHQM